MGHGKMYSMHLFFNRKTGKTVGKVRFDADLRERKKN